MIIISADSTCDLSQQLIEELDIAIIPLSVIVNEEIYKDGVDIAPADVFRFFEEGKLCNTGAVNVFEYQKHFRKLSSESDAVIHICLGSGLSSCYANAMLAAADFPNVYVLDSRNLSTGSGHLVCDAAALAALGVEPEEIHRRLKAAALKVNASFIIDQLEYLARGGRCSSITAQGAKILKLKPSIEVREGTMVVGRKFRGNFDKAATAYVRKRLQNGAPIDPKRIFITHAGCAAETVEAVRFEVEKLGLFEEILITEAGCTISNHCGPNTLGVLFKYL